MTGPTPLLERLANELQQLPVPVGDPAHALRRLVHAGLDVLTLPGSGHTLERWRALSAVGAHDLSLAKLYEGHTDALAILNELDGEGAMNVAHATWAVWAAEAPGARVEVQGDGAQACISGTKAWCSAAQDVSHALLTAWAPGAKQPQLVAVTLRQPGVSISTDAWQAVGMAASGSADVHFEAVPVQRVGAPGAYLSRPGFWQGGAGVAACWLGGAVALSRVLLQACAPVNGRSADPHRLAALGRVDVCIGAAVALLREAASWIDAHPRDHAQHVALRVRQCVEATARCVLEETTRALGATPLCRDAAFARRAADLPVFIRQSHAARDDAAMGDALAQQHSAGAPDPWTL